MKNKVFLNNKQGIILQDSSPLSGIINQKLNPAYYGGFGAVGFIIAIFIIIWLRKNR